MKYASQDGVQDLRKFWFTNISLIEIKVLKLSARDFLICVGNSLSRPIAMYIDGY